MRQMVLDGLSTFEDDANGYFYYYPNGDRKGQFDNQPEVWYGDGFYTEAYLDVEEDSLINHYYLIWGDTTYARIPVPYAVIDSVSAVWYEYQMTQEIRDRAGLSENPLLPTLQVFLNEEYDLNRINYIIYQSMIRDGFDPGVVNTDLISGGADRKHKVR